MSLLHPELPEAPGILYRGLRAFRSSLFVLLLFGAWSAGCTAPAEPAATSLTIAAAANLRFALRALTTAYTDSTGVLCTLIFASSGKLTAQIGEGAPYDIFLSADDKYPAALYSRQLTDGPPQPYARGQLALWTTRPEVSPLLEELSGPGVRRIALPNSATAPYGRAAEEVLRARGLYDSLRPRLVYGESVAQANQFVATGAAEMGFTAVSWMVAGPVTERFHRWTPVAPGAHAPLRQSIVVLRRDAQRLPAAREFKNFLLGPVGQAILREYGYLPAA